MRKGTGSSQCAQQCCALYARVFELTRSPTSTQPECAQRLSAPAAGRCARRPIRALDSWTRANGNRPWRACVHAKKKLAAGACDTTARPDHCHEQHPAAGCAAVAVPHQRCLCAKPKGRLVALEAAARAAVGRSTRLHLLPPLARRVGSHLPCALLRSSTMARASCSYGALC